MSSAETSEVFKSTKRADVLMGWPVVLFDWLERASPVGTDQGRGYSELVCVRGGHL